MFRSQENTLIVRKFIRLAVRAIFVWPWNENARTKQKQQTNGNRAIWLVFQRIQTLVGFGWLSERSAEKTSCLRTFLKSIDTSLWRHTATRLANRTVPSPCWGFWRENEETMFASFHSLAYKTNNEHLPKPFFKVIRKFPQVPCKQSQNNEQFRMNKQPVNFSACRKFVRSCCVELTLVIWPCPAGLVH